MKLLATILSAFVLGLYHGMGIDHITAITALVGKEGKKARPIALGVRFGLGHMLVLLIFGSLCLVTKFTLPAEFERGTEIFGGVLLVGLGLWLLADRMSSHLYFHKHKHVHDDVYHEHAHGHVGDAHPAEHAHLHLATFLGGAFALSGVVRLLIIVPTVLLAATLWQGVVYIAIFGLGIILSMGLYGFLLTRFFDRLGSGEQVYRITSLVAGLASIAVGLVWIGSHVV